MKVLAVVAHPDDEVLGVGATLAKHAMAGDDVLVVILGTGAMARVEAEAHDVIALCESAVKAAAELAVNVQMNSLPDNRFDSVDLLDVVQMVEGMIRQHRPEVVYTHSNCDLNVDHRITHRAVVTACRPLPTCTVRKILAFETPSSTEWADMGPFNAAVFVDVSGEPFDRKGRALLCYQSELRPAPHPRSIAGIEALGAWRGATSGVSRAEAFELIWERA